METNKWRKRVSKLFIIPQRYVLGVMGLFAICNAYTMRVCLNLAITQMVYPNSVNSSHFDPDACPGDNIANPAGSRPHAAFSWDEPTQGLILSAFYYGYAITQVWGGLLSERFGGKWILGLGLLSTALLTFVTPVVAKAGGAWGLFFLRVLQGMGEGPSMPGLMTVLARWTPPDERSVQGALVFGGSQIGNIFGAYMSGVLMSDGGDWANVFYFFGIFGILWFLAWSVLCFSTPQTHPYITDKELKYLETHVDSVGGLRRPPVPWKALLRSVPVWALMAAAVGHDWGYYVMVTDLPKYMTDVLKFNISETGTLTALPYVSMWIASFVMGFICDLCVKRGWHSILFGRNLYTTIAATGPAICIVLASYSGCDREAAVALFIAAMGLMGGFYSGMKVNALDIAPNYAGSVTAVINSISTISGIISPYLIGLITTGQTLAQWRVAFWITFVILVGTNVVYVIWSDGKQQWWDEVDKHGYPSDWKHGPLPKLQDVEKNSKLKNETSTANDIGLK